MIFTGQAKKTKLTSYKRKQIYFSHILEVNFIPGFLLQVQYCHYFISTGHQAQHETWATLLEIKRNVPPFVANRQSIFTWWWGGEAVRSDGGGDAGWQPARLKLKFSLPWNEKRPTGPIKWLLLSGCAHKTHSTLHPFTSYTLCKTSIGAESYVSAWCLLVQGPGGVMALFRTLTVMTLSLAPFR